MIEPETERPKLKRTSKPLGYRIGDEQRRGFPDDPRLSRGQRLRIAGWARALAPESLTDSQRELLGAVGPLPSPAQKQAATLSSFESSPYWNLLDEPQRALVRRPSLHPDLAKADYPLGVGQLAKLVGATPDKVRYWHNSGLLPARRSSGRYREFYEAAAARAFYVNGLSRAEISVLRDLVRGEGAPLLLGISAALYDRLPSIPASEQDLIRRAATDLEQVGAVEIAARRGASSKDRNRRRGKPRVTA